LADVRAKRRWDETSHGAEPAGAAGDVSLDGLYRSYFVFTWRVLRHLGLPESALEDAVQDVWLTVHRQLARFEGRSTHRTWLFGIALNVARNHHRSERRHPSGARFDVNAPASGPSPEARTDVQRSLGLVSEFLEALDEPRRVLFVTHFLEGLTPAESAEVLGIEVSLLYERIRRLRRALERWFQQRSGGGR
jgi:RNA polymerase sigma-70 factor (ECF subfamily)